MSHPQEKEKTFTTFTSQQANAYASTRGQLSYPSQLYNAITSYHESANGPNSCKSFLDIGTGPGKVAFDLLKNYGFEKGIGCDASSGMVEQARRDAESKGLSERCTFVVKGGEECGDMGEQVDLVTVAMAVHWFDLPRFYASCAKTLKPIGTLAMWTCSSMYIHPSHPRQVEIQAILNDLEDNMLLPFATPGNILSRTGYEGLSLPWDLEPCASLFDKSSFERVEWDRNGVPSAPPLGDGTPGPFVVVGHPVPIAGIAQALGSSSMVIRWREAYPDKANTEEDPVKITVKKLREANDGKEEMWLSASLSLLLMRRI